jgi:hypothetical protein
MWIYAERDRQRVPHFFKVGSWVIVWGHLTPLEHGDFRLKRTVDFNVKPYCFDINYLTQVW